MSRTLHRVTALLFPLLVSQPAWAQPRTDQEVTPNAIVDHGYLFQLARPGLGWQLMDEADVRRIVPDAVAGAIQSDTGMFMVVIPETAPTVNVESMAQFILETMPLDQRFVEAFEPITFEGLPATRFRVTGSIQGAMFRYANTVVGHRGYLYQVLCAGLLQATSPTGSDFEALWNSFSFLPGEVVPGRNTVRSVPDTTGVGWRVRDGAFESAAYGIAVEPTLPGWRVSIGAELDLMSPDAEVGLFLESPEIYLVLIPERVAGVDRGAFASGLRTLFASDIGAPPESDLTVVIGGQTVNLSLYQVFDAGQMLDFAHGVLFHGEHAVQVLAWWVSDLRGEVTPRLAEAAGQIRLLDEATRQRLRDAMALEPDPQNTVSHDYAVRGGLYRDYAYDFTWRKPAGFWRILSGQMARSVNPDARLYIEEPSLGLAGVVIAERAPGFDSAAYHDLVLGQMLPAGHVALSTPPEQRVVGDLTILSSWADLYVDDLDMRYLIATSVRDDRLVQLLMWGLPANVAASEPAVWQAVDGLALPPDDVQPSRLSDDRFSSDRLGFSLRSPRPGWKVEDITPPPVSAFGSIVQASPDSHHGIIVFAVCATAEGQDETWFHGLVESALLSHMGSVVGPATVESFAGRPARHLAGTAFFSGGRFDLYLLQRDRTFIAAVAFDEDGLGPPLAELIGAVELID